MTQKYLPTIGIECHVQLATKTKLFSTSDNDARDKSPNSCVNEVDFGLPGMLPVLNKHAVTLTIKAGCALQADIAAISRFDRKHYFYPDLPKGYQISQLYQPIIGSGKVDIELPDGTKKSIRINHAHLEEDAGKLTHHKEYSLVDLNRAGTPLIEIVSEPDIHSAQEAKAYAQELYLLMTYAGVTLGDLYHGNMRFDVNVSVAPEDSPALGLRTETKNLNSFKSVERATEYEIQRQIALLEKGEKIVQETRGWNEAKQKTTSQRSKEDAHDYRYMPDPDIPPIVLSQDMIEDIRQSMPKLHPEYRQEFEILKLDSSVITALLNQQRIAETVLMVLHQSNPEVARRVANWYASSIDGTAENDNRAPIDTERLVSLSQMVTSDQLNSTAAKKIFNNMLQGNDDSPENIATKQGLMQTSDATEIRAIIRDVLNNPAASQAIGDIKNGNEKAIGFLIGLVMKQSKGKVNPGLAQKLIKQELAK